MDEASDGRDVEGYAEVPASEIGPGNFPCEGRLWDKMNSIRGIAKRYNFGNTVLAWWFDQGIKSILFLSPS